MNNSSGNHNVSSLTELHTDTPLSHNNGHNNKQVSPGTNNFDDKTQVQLINDNDTHTAHQSVNVCICYIVESYITVNVVLIHCTHIDKFILCMYHI